MGEIFAEFLQNYTGQIIFGILTAIAGIIGTALKKEYEEASEDKKKKEIIANAVKFVEQVHKNLHGSEKLKKAMESASKMLAQKGINITELELIVLIEATLCELNNAFDKASWEKGIEEVASSEANSEPVDGEEIVEEATAETVG